MTSVKGFRHEADMQLSKAAEARTLLCKSLDLANERLASMTAQINALGLPSEDLQRTLTLVRNDLLMAKNEIIAAHEVVIGGAQKLATHLEWLWPWMKQRYDEIIEARRCALKEKDKLERTLIEVQPAVRRYIIIGVTPVALMIGASTWVLWQNVSAIQQSSAMCRYGERLIAMMPELQPAGQEWIQKNILTPRPGN